MHQITRHLLYACNSHMIVSVIHLISHYDDSCSNVIPMIISHMLYGYFSTFAQQKHHRWAGKSTSPLWHCAHNGDDLALRGVLCIILIGSVVSTSVMRGFLGNKAWVSRGKLRGEFMEKIYEIDSHQTDRKVNLMNFDVFLSFGGRALLQLWLYSCRLKQLADELNCCMV